MELRRWAHEHPRGYGLWRWKPTLLLEALQYLQGSGATLYYMDAGCELITTPQHLDTLDRYDDRIRELGCLTFELPGHPELSWSKAELWGRFSQEHHWATDQRLAGVLGLTATKSSTDLVHEWARIVESEPELLADPADLGEQTSEFTAHRHDQSVWSLLSKEADIPAIPDETYNMQRPAQPHECGPIWAARNRSSRSMLAVTPIAASVRRFELSTVRFKRLLRKAPPPYFAEALDSRGVRLATLK